MNHNNKTLRPAIWMKILFCFVVFLYIVSPISHFTFRMIQKGPITVGFDFALRYAETQCLREGVDPYDVWSEKVCSTRFRPLCKTHQKNSQTTDTRSLVHSYVPWVYAFMYPFTFMPFRCAAFIFICLNFAAFCYIFFFFWNRFYILNHDKLNACVVASAACAQGICLMWIVHTFNFGLMLTAALLLFVVALEQRDHYLAGCLWALLMFKVQIGALFFFPLLFAKCWKTIIVGGISCLTLTLLPAILTDKNPIELILNVRNIGNGYISYSSGGLFSFLTGSVSANTILIADFFSGFIGFLIASSFVHKHQDWVVRLLPASVFCLLWTYSQPHDRCLLSLPLGWTMSRVFQAQNRQHRFLALSAYAVYALPGLMGWINTQFICHWSFNRTYSIIDSFCLWSVYTITLVVCYSVRQSAHQTGNNAPCIQRSL